MNFDEDNNFYKESRVLLDGAIIELTSKIEMMRKYRVVNRI